MNLGDFNFQGLRRRVRDWGVDLYTVTPAPWIGETCTHPKGARPQILGLQLPNIIQLIIIIWAVELRFC